MIISGFISDLYYELENVKGVDPTKEKNAFNKDLYIEKYYGISDLISEMEKEKSILDEYLESLDRIFSKIADPEMKRSIKAEYMDDELISRKRT